MSVDAVVPAGGSAPGPSLAERLAALSPAQRAFVESRLAQAASAADPELIPRRAADGPAPLSFPQALLWTIEQSAEGGSTYSVPRALRIAGALDVERLRTALDQLVARHESLRTTYGLRDGEPVAIVGPARPVELRPIDLASEPADERERLLQQTLRAAASERFDLTRDLLLRATLVRLDAGDHALLLVSHHVASDEGSAGILFGDLARCYDASASAPLPELAVRYADFAAWQREYWAGDRLAALVAHWRGALQGAPDGLDLPLDRPRPALPDFAGARRSRTVSSALARDVERFARSRGTTLFVTLLAAFQTLLHRYSRQDDFVVGSVFSGRARPELDGVLGVFSNVLPLRAQFAGDPTFAQFLAGAHERYLDAAEHAAVPFDRIVLELSERGATGVPRAFQTMFSLAASGPAAPTLGDVSVEPIELDRGIARVDLGLAAAPAAGGLQLSAEYRTQLFDGGTIERMLANFETLLSSIVADADRPVSQLPLLSAPERALVLREQRGAPTPYPRDATLQTLLAAQARRSPGAIALEAETPDGALVRLSYAQLDARAEALARRLRALGVRPGVGVGVCADRSFEAVVALLGVLKSGGYYLPLDPEYPAERLEFMLRDSGVPVVLTLARLRSADVDFTAPAGVQTLLLDRDEEPLARRGAAPDALAPPAATADDPAYVIYTSGSTGVPKGVMVPQRALVNFLTSMAREPGLSAGDAVLAVTTFSFDIAGLEIWQPLLVGARLVLATRASAVDGRVLAERLASSGATLLQATPATWRLLLAAGWSGDSRLTMLCGGEALPPDLAAALVPRGRALWNMYGPTETTIWSALWRVRAGEPVSLGRAVANTHLYVLEPGGEPAPFGVAGELCIGGDGVALGYLGRAELTDERFVADPFDPNGAGRMYRTGDLVRRSADGRLEYLGRLDTQVKLRGFRIELGEIEAALGASPGVRQAVAAVREDVPGDPRLIAYLVAETPLDEDALRARLRGALPAYMVPSAFVRLGALPLTANGKLDRKALPAPDPANAAPSAAAPPRTHNERAILRLLLDVLRCEAAGVDDDFFELGGHSLLAMRLLDRIAATLGVRLPLRALFEAPTVAALAARLDAESVRAQVPPAQPVPSGGAAEPVLLSPAQEMLWTLQSAAGDTSAYNVRIGRRLRGPLERDALQRALNHLVARHAALRTVVGEVGGVPLQRARATARVELQSADLRELDDGSRDARAKHVLTEFGARPFDVSRDVLFRALLVTFADDDHVLLLVSHHIVTDGASVGIVLRDLSALYAAELVGEPARLPKLHGTFAEHVAGERERMNSQRRAENAAFWHGTVEGATPALALPFDRKSGGAPTFAGAREVSFLPRDLADGIVRVAKRQNATPFIVLLASYATLLHRLTAQDDILIGSPVDGRNAPEHAEMVGYFVNVLPFRVRFAGNPSFATVIAALSEASFAAYERQPAPSETTEFATLFVYGIEDDSARLGPLVTSPFVFETGSAKMDLSLGVNAGRDGLRVAFEYRTDVFDAATVRRFSTYLRRILEEVVADADRPVSAFSLMDADERRSIVIDVNAAAAVPFPRDATVCELFTRQAAAAPDAIAAVEGTASLAYGELDERSNRLARYLQRLGVATGTPVGVYMRRSLDLPVALLAILKAGGYYVPLESSYPAERLAFIVRDTGLTVIVTQSALSDTAPQVPNVVALDALRTVVACEESSPPPSSAHAGSRAYVMYTSGSTGEPKGVAIPHRGIVRLVRAANYAHFGNDEVVLGFAPLGFDLSTLELWGPLLNGGRHVLAGSDGLSLDELGAAIRTHGITTMWLTAALFHEMVDRDVEALRGLRQLLAGGDVLSTSHVRRAVVALPGCRLINGYGPTENTTFTTCFTVPHDWNADGTATSVPIGVPIANTSVYVLDDRLEPVPIGAVGTLYAGGDGVALGYHNRPELTARRFVRDPFRADPDARMYDTGDRARWRSDGTLEFVGRVDNQVKLRGFRIELGEIESALAQLPQVREAVVVLRHDSPGDPALTAYYTHLEDDAGSDGERERTLRAHLSARLPAFMLPAQFVALDAFPINASGKIDRKALPAPDRAYRRDAGVPFAGPSSAVEIVVAKIVRDTLAIAADVGLDDDFFLLGGHSLLAMRLVARLSKSFRLTLSIRSFFDAPTVRGIVAALQAGQSAPGRTDAIARALLALMEMSPEERERRSRALREASSQLVVRS